MMSILRVPTTEGENNVQIIPKLSGVLITPQKGFLVDSRQETRVHVQTVFRKHNQRGWDVSGSAGESSFVVLSESRCWEIQ